MKERPILFSAAMVRAILDGRKTQTRRVVKPQGAILTDEMARSFGIRPPATQNQPVIKCPYGQPGDRLWVRETTKQVWIQLNGSSCCSSAYSADGVVFTYGWDYVSGVRPSIHMPRWASRINLEITGIRVERLQDITRQDSFAEGIQNLSDGDYYEFGIRGLCTAQHPVRAYQLLWESINGQGSWELNPWVWVIEFKRVD